MVLGKFDKKMTGIIIQARLGSTRLPNKMIKPFYEGKGVLELLINKIKLIIINNRYIFYYLYSTI